MTCVISVTLVRPMTNDTENNNFIARLNSIIGKSGDNKKTFAKKCGVSEKQLYIYLKGTSEPSMRFFMGMKKQYPWVNIDWLVTGVGSQNIGRIDGDLSKNPRAEENGKENIVELKHADVIRNFKDKANALTLNMDLVDIEALNPTAYKEVSTYIKGVAYGVRVSQDRRHDQRRTHNDQEAIPEEGDRRQGKSRRAVNGD